MKLTIAGVQRIQGTSKAGNSFDMCQAITLVQVENVNNPKVKISGHGFKQMEMNLDPSALEQFSGVKFPAVLDVVLEPRPYNGKYETTIVALAKAA